MTFYPPKRGTTGGYVLVQAFQAARGRFERARAKRQNSKRAEAEMIWLRALMLNLNRRAA